MRKSKTCFLVFHSYDESFEKIKSVISENDFKVELNKKIFKTIMEIKDGNKEQILSAISNIGKMEKRFDFVIKTPNMIYGIETNFYGSGGSKLNETARSYKTLALETDTIDGFTFVWFTDGKGWTSARHNLEETFDVMEHIYNIKDLENGILFNLRRN